MATWFELVLSMQICPKNVFDNHFSVHWNYPLTENVFQKRKKNSFLFFAFCKSGGSWKQPHTLIIRITTREFNLTEGRERGPPRGSTTALGKTEHETSLRNPWVTGETGSWKTAAGSSPDSQERLCGQSKKCWWTKPDPGPDFHAGRGRLTKSQACVQQLFQHPLWIQTALLLLCLMALLPRKWGMRTFYFPLLWFLLDSQQEYIRMQALDLSSDSAWLRKVI